MAKYRILSLDGGGVRGILTARLLERIAAERPDMLANIDLIAGTSAGALVGVALALGRTPTEIVALTRALSPVILRDSFWDDLVDLGNIRGSQYNTANRRNAFSSLVGDKTLNDLLPNRVLIPTFQLDNHNPICPVPENEMRRWKAKFFHNYPGPDSDGEQKILDVLLRTTASPTYFPLYQGFIDGGVVANNPSMCALAQALHAPTGNQSLKDVVLLSLGTGAKQQFIEARDNDWGLFQWSNKLVSMMMDTSINAVHYQCQQMLGDQYCRIQPDLMDVIRLDAVERLEELVTVADHVDLTPTIHWLDAHWRDA